MFRFDPHHDLGSLRKTCHIPVRRTIRSERFIMCAGEIVAVMAVVVDDLRGSSTALTFSCL